MYICGYFDTSRALDGSKHVDRCSCFSEILLPISSFTSFFLAVRRKNVAFWNSSVCWNGLHSHGSRGTLLASLPVCRCRLSSRNVAQHTVGGKSGHTVIRWRGLTVGRRRVLGLSDLSKCHGLCTPVFGAIKQACRRCPAHEVAAMTLRRHEPDRSIS